MCSWSSALPLLGYQTEMKTGRLWHSGYDYSLFTHPGITLRITLLPPCYCANGSALSSSGPSRRTTLAAPKTPKVQPVKTRSSPRCDLPHLSGSEDPVRCGHIKPGQPARLGIGAADALVERLPDELVGTKEVASVVLGLLKTREEVRQGISGWVGGGEPFTNAGDVNPGELVSSLDTL